MMPEFTSAIANLTTEKQYADWVEPFVVKLIKICKPSHRVSLEEVEHP
jgi:hypothetical protein